MKHLFLFLMLSLCAAAQAQDSQALHAWLDSWHRAAATADAEAFFGKMAPECIYIGTDKTERWRRDELREWSKPYFARDTAWAFTVIERQLYFDPKGKMAWFDETLQTRMGVCRGSGVVSLDKKGWKLLHYHLSLTLDNALIGPFIELASGKAEVPPPAEAQEAAMQPIRQLFDAMRQGDGQALLDAFAEGATLHTAMAGKDGTPQLRPESIAAFAESVAKPHDEPYDERLGQVRIRIDGHLATAWAPYHFYVGERFSHCGVNAFQLVNTTRGWKILHITDTRRREGCNP
jgi:ketosteroid isomerase-like protein